MNPEEFTEIWNEFSRSIDDGNPSVELARTIHANIPEQLTSEYDDMHQLDSIGLGLLLGAFVSVHGK